MRTRTEGGWCLMPQIATAASADEEASSSRVDDLIQRGRSQGHLSLTDLRTAFETAGLQPAEARSILRELSEAGVRLADEETDLRAPRKAKPAAGKAAGTAKARAAAPPRAGRGGPAEKAPPPPKPGPKKAARPAPPPPAAAPAAGGDQDMDGD